MTLGQSLAQELKKISSPDGNDRLARAMYLANALGYQVAVDTSLPAIDYVETKQAAFNTVINAVVEYLSIDVKLTRALFNQVLRIRYELVNRVNDPAIIQMAMKSLTTEDHQNAEQLAMTEWLISRPDFLAGQNALTNIIASAPLDA